MVMTFNADLPFREWQNNGGNLRAVFGEGANLLYCTEETVLVAANPLVSKNHDPIFLPSLDAAKVALEARSITRLPFTEVIVLGNQPMAMFGKDASVLICTFDTVTAALNPAEALKNHHPVMLPTVSAAEAATRQLQLLAA